MKVTLQISKFGQFLSSRPDGREAALAALAYDQNLKNCTDVELDFADVLVLTPSWLSEFVQTLLGSSIRKVDFRASDNESVKRSIQTVLDDIADKKSHP